MALGRKDPMREYQLLKDTAAKARLPFDKDVWLNVAFYHNHQYVEWVDDAAALRLIPRSDTFPNAPRPVANKIMHFVNQEHAYVLQSKPTVDVLPATDDPMDASNAQVALAYTRWLSEPQVGDFDQTISEAALWALIAGESYIKWVFNPRLKRPDFMTVSPLDLYPDPYPTSFSKARYVIHSQFMDVEQVYDIWGVETKPSEVRQADPGRSQLLRDMGQAPVLSGVIVNELWMKPCRKYEDGLFVVWAEGNKTPLVAPTKFPYAHKRLPFTQVGSIPRPGCQHFTSAVTYLRSAQMELNKYHAQRILMREAFAAPKWWVPSELELEASPDDSPNQILRGMSLNGQLKPEIIPPSGFPQSDDGEWISNEMMNIVGLHEVSQAQVPGRVEAARAIELLKESDATRQSELLRTVKQSISEGNWQALMLAKQFVSEEQLVQTYSREGVPEVRRFKREKIHPGMRVQVTMGSGLARSRAARQDQLMTFWREGVIQDPEILSELLEVPLPTFMSTKAADIRAARNENYDLAKATPIQPNSWDDHEIHIREHNAYRKTSEFYNLPMRTKTMFEHHVSTHEQMQEAQLAKQARLLGIRQMAQQTGLQQEQMQEQQAFPNREQTEPGKAESEPAQPGAAHSAPANTQE